MWVAWVTASSSPPPSRGLKRAQVRNSSALPRFDSRSRRARVGYDQDGLELIDRLGPCLDRGVLGEFVHPGAVHRTVTGLGPSPGATAEHSSRCGLRVERVRLAEQTAGRAVGPVDFEHLDVLSQQVAGEARSEGARALHAGPAHRPPLAGPEGRARPDSRGGGPYGIDQGIRAAGRHPAAHRPHRRRPALLRKAQETRDERAGPGPSVRPAAVGPAAGVCARRPAGRARLRANSSPTRQGGVGAWPRPRGSHLSLWPGSPLVPASSGPEAPHGVDFPTQRESWTRHSTQGVGEAP